MLLVVSPTMAHILQFSARTMKFGSGDGGRETCITTGAAAGTVGASAPPFWSTPAVVFPMLRSVAS